MHYNYYPFENHNVWGMGVLMIIFWLIVIAGGAYLVATMLKNNSSATGSSTQEPLDIAKARYAKGEITKAEFDQLKQDLS